MKHSLFYVGASHLGIRSSTKNTSKTISVGTKKVSGVDATVEKNDNKKFQK